MLTRRFNRGFTRLGRRSSPERRRTMDVPAEAIESGKESSLPGPKCIVCSASVPADHRKYCSRACLAIAKRQSASDHYGHRHTFVCSECGAKYKPGRHRKVQERF